MHPIYPNDARLPIDPGYDGNPVKSELGPFPHVEGGHYVDWLASSPSTSKDVWGDGQLLVLRGATTDKLIPHVPAAPLAPPGPPVGLAETIANSKVLYLFSAPKVSVNGTNPAVVGFLSPPLRCQKIRLPIPAGLAKLAATAQSKALRAKTTLESLAKAQDAVNEAKDAFDATKQGLLGVLHKQVTGDGRSEDLMGGLVEMGEAKLKQKKAELALAEAKAGQPNQRAASIDQAASGLQRAQDREALAAQTVKKARAKEQEARKRERDHQAEQQRWETEAERAKLARDQNVASTRASRQHGRQEEQASTTAFKQAQKAHQEADQAQRSARHYEQASRKHGAVAEGHRQTAAAAEHRRQQAALDRQTAETIAAHEERQGHSASAQEERRRAEHHRQAEQTATAHRDAAHEQARVQDTYRDAHARTATQRRHDAAAYRELGNQHYEASQQHHSNAAQCRQSTRYGAEQSRREHAAKQEAKQKAKASAKRAEQARNEAEAHAKAAKTAKQDHRAAQKARRAANRALGRHVAPCVDILVPSIASLIVLNRKATVTIDISLGDWLVNWMRIAGVVASDILNGYMGFISETYGSFAGPMGAWAFEHVGALLQSEVNVFRNWLITDTIQWVIPVKVGQTEITTTLTRDPKTGEKTWKVTGKRGEFQATAGAKSSPNDGTTTVHGNLERGRFKAESEWTHRDHAGAHEGESPGWTGTHRAEMAKSGAKGSASVDYVEDKGGWQRPDVDGDIDPQSLLDKPKPPRKPAVGVSQTERQPPLDGTAGIPTV